MNQKRIPYDECIGRVFGEWTVLRVMRSKEHSKRVYFEAQCSCGRVCQPGAGDILSGKTHRCKWCARARQHRKQCEQRKREPVPAREHAPVTQTFDGETVTLCGKCWMQSTWPGWSNPCGSPVVAVKRGEEA